MGMRVTPWHLLGGIGLYGASTYVAYTYIASHKLPTGGSEGDAAEPGGHVCTYDAIADKYDSAVGSEEFGMGTPLLRRWILNHAHGDVLEISAGTGRSLPYYTLKNIKSLTLADLSMPMLERAEDKFYDDLKLGEQHPNTRIRFCISDAHCMTASEAEVRAGPSPVHTLPAIRQRMSREAGSSPAGPASSRPVVHPKAAALAAASEASTSPQDPNKEQGSSFSRLFRSRAAPSDSVASAPAGPAPAPAPAPAGRAELDATPARPAHQRAPSDESAGGELGPQEKTSAGTGGGWRSWLSLPSRGSPVPSSGGGDCSAAADGEGRLGTCSCSGAHGPQEGSFQARCARGATAAGLPLSRFPAASFDTVVDAFGLCSHDDPVQVLREAARVCKPEGRILLLEHGRGHYDWLNSRLDSSAEQHHKKWGCWWNRDIEAIIQKAGLQMDKMSRWHFGTTYICIARPGRPDATPAQA